jgi:Ca2+-binding RTX toxin-like protein
MSYSNNSGIVSARAPDGSGNNAGGQSFSTYVRVSENNYADGKGTVPAGVEPRKISDELMDQPISTNIPSSFGINENFQFFGQFITHDITQGAVGSAPSPKAPPEPAIQMEGGFPGGLSRTDARIDGDGVRQQITEETSFLDLSMVYGSNQATLDLLRDNQESHKLVTHSNGMLATAGDIVADSGNANAGSLLGFGPNPNSYATGDQRANQTPMLLTLQTIFAREHNRLADEIKAEHGDWSNDQVFDAARALNEAQWQSIVYREYLPKLLGDGALSGYSGHKPGVNPGAINEWANSAFRFGHDQSSNFEQRLNEDGSAAAAPITLAAAFGLGFSGAAFGSPNGATNPEQTAQLDQYLRGLTGQSAQEIDGKVVDGNRNALFGIPGLSLDLEAIDLMRARDHGVSDLDNIRTGLGLKEYQNINSFVGQNNAGNALGREVREKLDDLYGGDIGAVDATLAGLLEKAVKGGMLGETFHLLTKMQFENVRDGDAQFYLNRFNGDLVKEIEGTSLAELYMQNTGAIVYHDAFMAHNRTSGDGGAGRDLVVGSAAANTQKGGAGSDDLYGLAGADKQDGGDGNDYMNGGADADIQKGGKGNDIFIYKGASGKDVVTDFENGKDRIDLSDYDVTFAQVKAQTKASGKDVVIDIGAADGGPAGVNTITLQNMQVNKVDDSDFLFY